MISIPIETHHYHHHGNHYRHRDASKSSSYLEGDHDNRLNLLSSASMISDKELDIDSTFSEHFATNYHDK